MDEKMTVIYRIIAFLITAAAANSPLLCTLTGLGMAGRFAVYCVSWLLFVAVNVAPPRSGLKRLRVMVGGVELIKLFVFIELFTLAVLAAEVFCPELKARSRVIILLNGLSSAAVLAILFFNGYIRIIATSVQLGVVRRVVLILFWWLPIVNMILIVSAGRLTEREFREETLKAELDKTRAESRICETKYPILLVHGVFFRDFRLLNYWGRIPAELKRNGARVFLGQQQSALPTEQSAAELADRIKTIVKATNCGKVNIIAHSKGGLDARYAISRLGVTDMTASLTTINTPHRGCAFAEYLLEKVPDGLRNAIARSYNKAMKLAGDKAPDFLGAVESLTVRACEKMNGITPDADGVEYGSVMSYMNKAGGAGFPLNLTYRIVRKFSGRNDGLVDIKSAKWGSDYKLLQPASKRGISHGDMIDMCRENIKGFDVREYYVNMVSELKKRGL